jgi:hypothetical protein
MFSKSEKSSSASERGKVRRSEKRKTKMKKVEKNIREHDRA